MEMRGQLHTPASLLPGKEAPASLPPAERAAGYIGQETGRVPEPVWTLWSTEKFLAPARNRTPAVQPVARRYTDWANWAIPTLRFGVPGVYTVGLWVDSAVTHFTVCRRFCLPNFKIHWMSSWPSVVTFLDVVKFEKNFCETYWNNFISLDTELNLIF
jgi:hypothetical protein